MCVLDKLDVKTCIAFGEGAGANIICRFAVFFSNFFSQLLIKVLLIIMNFQENKELLLMIFSLATIIIIIFFAGERERTEALKLFRIQCL